MPSKARGGRYQVPTGRDNCCLRGTCICGNVPSTAIGSPWRGSGSGVGPLGFLEERTEKQDRGRFVERVVLVAAFGALDARGAARGTFARLDRGFRCRKPFA